jgi:predicted 3-demethylubiquinone-9 3-methyltransferase (glyoxalase superfamily)
MHKLNHFRIFYMPTAKIMLQHPIMPCIWSEHQGAETAQLYTAAFPGTSIMVSTPMVVTIDMAGQPFMILNGGPKYRPNPSISFFAVLESKDAVDRAFQQLSPGGKVMMPLDTYPWSGYYAWVEDRFGVNWQLFLGSRQSMGGDFIPSLMFTGSQAGKAEEAMGFYTSVFPNGEIVDLNRYEEGEPDITGTIKHGRFKINGQPFAAMDSSFMHGFGFSEGISLVITCDTQAEIDYFWNSLTEGGEESMCGWLKDRFGVSWQVVPAMLPKLMSDPERGQRVINAFLQMRKFDIASLMSA